MPKEPKKEFADISTEEGRMAVMKEMHEATGVSCAALDVALEQLANFDDTSPLIVDLSGNVHRLEYLSDSSGELTLPKTKKPFLN